jgi:putative membrane protein
MMYWGSGIGGWGMLLMTVSTLLFWGLLIAGIIALVRYTGHSRPQSGSAIDKTANPERILAERFARGEIDQDEYTQRLQVLRSGSGTPAAR